MGIGYIQTHQTEELSAGQFENSTIYQVSNQGARSRAVLPWKLVQIDRNGIEATGQTCCIPGLTDTFWTSLKANVTRLKVNKC